MPIIDTNAREIGQNKLKYFKIVYFAVIFIIFEKFWGMFYFSFAPSSCSQAYSGTAYVHTV